MESMKALQLEVLKKSSLGDRYPGSTFIDHMLRFEQDPNCKMLVLLGEVGGVEEYAIAEAVKVELGWFVDGSD